VRTGRIVRVGETCFQIAQALQRAFSEATCCERDRPAADLLEELANSPLSLSLLRRHGIAGDDHVSAAPRDDRAGLRAPAPGISPSFTSARRSGALHGDAVMTTQASFQPPPMQARRWPRRRVSRHFPACGSPCETGFRGSPGEPNSRISAPRRNARALPIRPRPSRSHRLRHGQPFHDVVPQIEPNPLTGGLFIAITRPVAQFVFVVLTLDSRGL